MSAEMPSLRVLALFLLLAASARAGTPEPAPSSPLKVRCERVLPKELRDKYFSGWEARESSKCPECPTICSFEKMKKPYLFTSITYTCLKEGVGDLLRRARSQTVPPLEGLGAFAFQDTENGMARVAVEDTDAPCAYIVRYKGARQGELALSIAREVMEATTAEAVNRPVYDAIIWGGSTKAEMTQKWLADWEQLESPAVNQLVKLTPGYPQALASERVPGLKPGFHVLVLGFCPAGPEGPQVAEMLSAFQPGIYTRRVDLPEGATAGCPKRLEDPEAAVGYEVKSAKGRKLIVGSLYDNQRTPPALTYFATLREASGQPLVPPVVLFHPFELEAPICPEDMRKMGSAVVVEKICSIAVGCEDPGKQRERTIFSVKGSTVDVREEKTVLRRPNCDTGD